MELFANLVKPKKLKSVSYEKFVAMTNELGTEASNEESIIAILKTFYQNDSRTWIECVNEFNSLITTEYTKPIKLDLDFENKEAKYFIIADRYVANSDLVSLYNHLSGKKVKDISVPFAKRVKDDFLRSVEHFKDKWDWLYNPPILPGINKHSIGRQLRQEFQEYYGQYTEITYLIAITESISFNEANKKPLMEYLSVGEYLIRKRACESIT